MRVWPNRNGRVCVWGIEWSAPVRPQQDIRNLFSNSKIYMSLTTPLLCVCALCVCKMEKHRENTLMGGWMGGSLVCHMYLEVPQLTMEPDCNHSALTLAIPPNHTHTHTTQQQQKKTTYLSESEIRYCSPYIEFNATAKKTPCWAVFNFGTSSKQLTPACAALRLRKIVIEEESGNELWLSSVSFECVRPKIRLITLQNRTI